MGNKFKHLIERWKLRRLVKKSQKHNPIPKTWCKWEYNRWGYKIAFMDIKIALWDIDKKKQIINIVGWLPEKPRKGDWLVYEYEIRKYAKGIIYDIEYLNNPPDMFFAKVKPVEEVII